MTGGPAGRSGGAAQAAPATPLEDWYSRALSFQAEALADLEASAGHAGEGVPRCAAWMAVQRQAARLQRMKVSRSLSQPLLEVLGEKLESHAALLDDTASRAASRVSTYAEATRREAKRRLGLRIAVAGKGGAGKSLISGTLARLLARKRRRVLAADLDPNPGLAYAIGIPSTDAGLPSEALDGENGRFTHLAPGITPSEAVARFGVQGPDRLSYLGIGKVDDPERLAQQRSRGPIVSVLLNLSAPEWTVVGDLEAGLTTPFQRSHMFADAVVLVTTPSWKSSLTVRRLLPIVDPVPHLVVANQWRGEPDPAGLAPLLRIPYDEAVIEADRHGVPLIDHDSASPAIAAIEELAQLLEKEVQT